ncbi:uncharacterized protein LOC118184192 isoform X1 [Stegodyphus dumicola]|uniref:uncharacterized protein LOC118184192 isoform X1 n=1 Tax=Stegodyphus dumicola TaxID=202533 RepID=UPI0015A89BEA|nr:uncharacterized protein LOC118184192 isoform X1 [Stegodyphus dumicola]
MYRKYYLVEVVILLLLSHGGWNGPSVTLLSCTSESSKLVRDVVQKRFLPVVERYRVSLPLECPLHPKRDMFWWLQTELEATKTAGEETWHCPVCGKKFRCENTFVTHWDASHSRTMGMTEETVCLDDYCDVFRCDILRQKMLKQRLEEEEMEKTATHKPTQFAALSIAHKHQQLEEDDEEIKQKKQMCNPKAMNVLQLKCRSLIRQCTIGMLANLSSKDFQDIEDDLDQSICSFLTCDKYWDDFDSQIHQVPTLVLAIFGLIIISLFCFCYYGTWVLMEKNPINTNQLCCNCQRSQSMEFRHKQKVRQYRYRQNSPEFQTTRRAPSRCGR